jgi:inner membrane protein
VDPLTHGLLGAAAGQLTASGERRWPSAAAGFVAALLADLDVLLSDASDPLYQLEFHRQFSHSLLFVPLGALLATTLLGWWPGRQMGWRKLYLACLAGYASAGLLDACTSYGTQLLWPFSDTRFAWNLVAVVDPVITLGLLGLLLLSLRRPARWAVLPLLWMALMLSYGGVQQHRARVAAHQLQQERGHQPTETVVKPTLGNQLLWRVCYIFEGRIYADGIRTDLLDSPRLYPGESAPLLVPERDFAALQGTRSYRDLERFARLSVGYLIQHPADPEVVADARYAMLPTSLLPLWGVKLDLAHPEHGVRFLTYRDSSRPVREAFLYMLSGE